jgi:hypothetical protein
MNEIKPCPAVRDRRHRDHTLQRATPWRPVALHGAVGGRGRIPCPGHCARVRARAARADRGASISTRCVAWVEEEIDEGTAARISSHRRA